MAWSRSLLAAPAGSGRTWASEGHGLGSESACLHLEALSPRMIAFPVTELRDIKQISSYQSDPQRQESIMRWLLVCSSLSTLAAPFVVFAADADSRQPTYVTAPYPTILLSANDGECRFPQTFSGLRQMPVKDSITVFRLGPDHSP